MAKTKKPSSKAAPKDPLADYVAEQGKALGPTSMAARMAGKPVEDWPSGYRDAVSIEAARTGHGPVVVEVDEA